jgi:hypothetical protein
MYNTFLILNRLTGILERRNMAHAQKDSAKSNRFVRYIYLFTILMLALTGFGQMPIFKRYYIADIPGLGWLAQFYVTHYMHYLAAIVFFALVAYFIVDYFMANRSRVKLSASGYVSSLILLGIITSGIFLVIRNLAGSQFSANFIIGLDLAHLGLVMLFLLFALYSVITKKQWTTSR